MTDPAPSTELEAAARDLIAFLKPMLPQQGALPTPQMVGLTALIHRVETSLKTQKETPHGHHTAED